MENSLLEVVNAEKQYGYVDEHGTVQLNAEFVARGLGFTRTEIKNGKEYTSILWHRVNKYLGEFGFRTNVCEKDFIPENIFYRLAMKASNAAAQKFQAKVADEILPSIRKNGVYLTAEAAERIILNPDFIIGLAQQVKDAQAKIAELEPKADYYEKVMHSEETLPVTIIAKDYGMSAVMFNQMLRSLKIQYPVNGSWALYQEYVGKGYTVTQTILTKGGRAKTIMYWTQKGREFLYYKLKKHGKVPTREREEIMAELWGA